VYDGSTYFHCIVNDSLASDKHPPRRHFLRSRNVKEMAVYSQCELCRRHHSEGRRHIYQKKHKERLKEVLGKFTEKVDWQW